MSKISYIKLFFFMMFVLLPSILLNSFVCAQQSSSWIEEKDKHFLIMYTAASDGQWARDVLRRAEDYYRKIADQIGYARYKDFWTWEDRVKIYIYPDEKSFHEITGQPTWSKGSAGFRRDESLEQTRFIATFKQEDDFLDGLLPHEISHLILRDYLGEKIGRIPVWFDEAVAQLQEKDKAAVVEQIMQGLVRKHLEYPLTYLISHEIRRESDPRKVAIFYAQSVSILDFLIKKYGSAGFGDLCQFMREGKSFEEAIVSAYRPAIISLEELEKKWLVYLNN